MPLGAKKYSSWPRDDQQMTLGSQGIVVGVVSEYLDSFTIWKSVGTRSFPYLDMSFWMP